ncbi:TPA: hypothetical protein SMR91_003617 [Proteus mirabilis]|nr:hypothetical protein [Proteus mirabilis]
MALIRNIIDGRDIINLSHDEKNSLLKKILECVKGVDINPLSVLTAKVCYYLSIKPLINGDDIEIPIYLGDSANIPKKYNVGKTLCYEYTVNTIQENIKVLLPASFVENKSFFSLMSQIQTIIKTENEQLVYEKFVQNILPEDINTEINDSIKNLSTQLVRLHKNNWDGIWIRIVANFMLVARIKNIDIIVGNPPWIKWEFLPQSYAEKIKKLCVDRHLFSGQTYMGAISLNICALIANVTASTWLSENGILVFLMPQTLMTQDSYAGFRNFYTNVEANERMYLQKLDDWTKAGNPFVDTQEKFMTYYYGKKVVDYFKTGIPITLFQKKKGVLLSDINSKQTFNEVANFFEKSSAKAFQMDKKRTGYTTLDESSLNEKSNFDLIIGECYYKARSGVEFTPAEIYFVEPKGSIKNKEAYIFQPSEFKNAKHKAISSLPVSLETKFVKPVIKAPFIEPFRIKENNNYCIFPYKYNESTSINTDELLEESPDLFKYFINNKKLIDKQSKRSLAISRGNAFYSLSKVGNYTFAPHKVTFRDNTKLSAAVVSEVVTPWGERVMPICAKHCPYISQDKDGNNISEDEAYFLCGILNTPIVQKYFKFTYSNRSFSINFNIKMPKYDSKNKYHKEIVILAKTATLDKPTDEIYKKLESNYLNICREI